jgi:hypothetical protein
MRFLTADIVISCSIFINLLGTTLDGQAIVFGGNVADGRIKGCSILDSRSGSGKKFTVCFARGNREYGENNFADNKEGTASDLATAPMWQKSDIVFFGVPLIFA